MAKGERTRFLLLNGGGKAQIQSNREVENEKKHFNVCFVAGPLV